jgi:hypothetical protein
MELEQGPIPELTAPVDPGQFIETPGFGPFTRAALSGTEALDVSFPDLEAILIQESFTNPAAIIDATLGDAPNQLGTLSNAALGAENSGAIDDYTNADELVQNAWDEMPGESFQPVPDPLSFPGGPPPTPQPGNGTITFTNLTRPGVKDFRVGDVLAVAIRVVPIPGGFNIIGNLPLTWWVYDNGGGPLLRKVEIGNTDQNGFLNYTMTLDYTWLGYWGVNIQTPGGLGQSLVIQFHFPVSPTTGPLPIYPRPITATLVNLTRPDHLDFHIGDKWTLTIHANPNNSVIIKATLNGTGLSDLPLPNTDDAAQLVLNGQMDAGAIGDWSEMYVVGGVRSVDPIVFTVR